MRERRVSPVTSEGETEALLVLGKREVPSGAAVGAGRGWVVGGSEGEGGEGVGRGEWAVLMVAHTSYRGVDRRTAGGVMGAPGLVDARGFVGADALQEAGFKYRLIGVGSKAAAHTEAAEPK